MPSLGSNAPQSPTHDSKIDIDVYTDRNDSKDRANFRPPNKHSATSGSSSENNVPKSETPILGMSFGDNNDGGFLRGNGGGVRTSQQ